MPPIPLSKNQQKRWEELFEKNAESDSEYVPYVLKLSFTAALKARRSYEDESLSKRSRNSLSAPLSFFEVITLCQKTISVKFSPSF